MKNVFLLYFGDGHFGRHFSFLKIQMCVVAQIKGFFVLHNNGVTFSY